MSYLALGVIAVLLVSALLPKRWLYRHGRPNRVAQLLNRGWAMAHAAGLWPSRWVTLQVPGGRTGCTISFPLAVADYQGERYLVAMLGEGSSWVRNVRAPVVGWCCAMGVARPCAWRRSTLPRGRRSCADTCGWRRGLVPIYRSMAMLRSKTLSGSRRSFLSFA